MNKEGGNRVYLPLSLVHPASCCLSNIKLSLYTVNKLITSIHEYFTTNRGYPLAVSTAYGHHQNTKLTIC